METRNKIGSVHLIVQGIDIAKYPEKTYHYIPRKNSVITLGDLHGNALKLINFLTHQNIITLSKEDYYLLLELYNKRINDINSIDLEMFDGIISKINIINTDGKIMLIGDDLADRGSNDYFTLKVIEKLNKNNVPMDILLSNHNAEFLRYYEVGFSANKFNPLVIPCDSLRNLNKLFHQGLVRENIIVNLVEDNYLKNLKLISYYVEEENNIITLFTHAPNNYSKMTEIANAINEFCTKHKIKHEYITYYDNTIEELKNTLDKINNAFQNIISAREITRFTGYDPNDISKLDETNFFFKFIWERIFDSNDQPLYKQEDFPGNKNGFFIRYCHGHDGGYNPHDIFIPKNVIVLDNIFGKFPRHSQQYQMNELELEYTAFVAGPGLMNLEGKNEIKVETQFEKVNI